MFNTHKSFAIKTMKATYPYSQKSFDRLNYHVYFEKGNYFSRSLTYEKYLKRGF